MSNKKTTPERLATFSDVVFAVCTPNNHGGTL